MRPRPFTEKLLLLDTSSVSSFPQNFNPFFSPQRQPLDVREMGKAWVRKLNACVGAKDFFRKTHISDRIVRKKKKQAQNTPITHI